MDVALASTASAIVPSTSCRLIARPHLAHRAARRMATVSMVQPTRLRSHCKLGSSSPSSSFVVLQVLAIADRATVVLTGALRKISEWTSRERQSRMHASLTSITMPRSQFSRRVPKWMQPSWALCEGCVAFGQAHHLVHGWSSLTHGGVFGGCAVVQVIAIASPVGEVAVARLLVVQMDVLATGCATMACADATLATSLKIALTTSITACVPTSARDAASVTTACASVSRAIMGSIARQGLVNASRVALGKADASMANVHVRQAMREALAR